MKKRKCPICHEVCTGKAFTMKASKLIPICPIHEYQSSRSTFPEDMAFNDTLLRHPIRHGADVPRRVRVGQRFYNNSPDRLQPIPETPVPTVMPSQPNPPNREERRRNPEEDDEPRISERPSASVFRDWEAEEFHRNGEHDWVRLPLSAFTRLTYQNATRLRNLDMAGEEIRHLQRELEHANHIIQTIDSIGRMTEQVQENAALSTEQAVRNRLTEPGTPAQYAEGRLSEILTTDTLTREDMRSAVRTLERGNPNVNQTPDGDDAL